MCVASDILKSLGVQREHNTPRPYLITHERAPAQVHGSSVIIFTTAAGCCCLNSTMSNKPRQVIKFVRILIQNERKKKQPII